MNENAGQFRTAAFGGFNRQDVLDYIEKLTQENQEKSLELERALEREETVRTQSEARFAEAEEQAAACEKLSEEVEQLRKDLAETQSALEEKTRLASDLQKQVRALEPEAKSWQRLKDTAGDIEVSAHERAQVTIQNAQSHAADLRALTCVGVLNETTGGVSDYHAALVYVLETDGEVTVRETEKMSGTWATPTELEAVRDRLETWSQIALDAVIHGRAR